MNQPVKTASGKFIYFPEIKSFDGLFDAWHWYETKNGRVESSRFPPIKIGQSDLRGNAATIDDYCAALNTSLENSLHVKPNEKLVEFIKKSMFLDSRDSIYFEIVERDDELLVLAKNNVIIGSRWLTLLPKSELKKIAEAAG